MKEGWKEKERRKNKIRKERKGKKKGNLRSGVKLLEVVTMLL